MSPEQAYQIIDSVVAQVAFTREQRQQVESALEVLKPSETSE